jgi:outer membrane autotransporter protein
MPPHSRNRVHSPQVARWLVCIQLIAALLLAAAPARALDWATLVQPVGTFVGNGANPDGIYAPATINTLLSGSPPFDSGTSVTLIRVTQTHQFVRFYNPTDAVNPSNAVGSWMMRASDVRGLTAAQIRDKFALPALPTNIVQVIVPASYALYTGIAAPIANWGDGGGLQNRVMATKPPAGIAADGFLPGSSYVNAQALASTPVLSYNAAASGSKAASGMGAYMDSLAPRAYSDLDGIYNALDTLVMTGQSASVAQAMSQFSPARFDALNTVSQRTSALQSASFDARATTLALGLDSGGADDAEAGKAILLAFAGGLEELAGVLPRLGQRQAKAGDFGLWLRGTGEYMRDNAQGAAPFTAVTAALHAGADRRVGPELVLGLGAGYARTQLDWEQDGGDSATSTFSLSAYGFWNSGEYFINSDLTLDAALTEARRRIVTAVTDRVARSSQSGEGANLRLRAGRRMALEQGGWTLTPAAELGYGLHRQNAFSENGAGDLNLDVRAATAQTLRTGAELAVSRRVDLPGDGVLVPEAALGWQRETPLDNRVTRASFSGYSQSFQSYGDDTPRDSLLLRAGLTQHNAEGLTRFARYSGTLRERFQAHSLELGCRWSF